MKKVFRFVLYSFFCVVCSLYGFSQSMGTENLFVPINPVVSKNPKTLAQGFAYAANAFGYNSFFYNPAGFAVKPTEGSAVNQGGTANFFSLNFWLFGDKQFYDMLSNPVKFMNDVKTQLTQFTKTLEKLSEDETFNDPQVFFDEVVKKSQVPVMYQSLMNLLTSDEVGLNLTGRYPTLDEIVKNEEALNTWLGSGAGSNREKLQTLENNQEKLEFIGKKIVGIVVENLFDYRHNIVSEILPGLPQSAQAGLSLGYGFIKDGLGIGLMTGIDFTFSDEKLYSLEMSPTVMLNVGYAFTLLEERLLLGFNVRPLVKVGFLQVSGAYIANLYSRERVVEMLTNPQYANDMFPLYSGFGFGLDFGALYRLTPNISLSAVLKDAPTFLRLHRPQVDFFDDDSVFSMGQLFGSAMPNIFYVPPDLVLGVGWQTNKNNWYSISANVQIDNWLPMIVFANTYKVPFNWLKMIKIGTEFGFFQVVTLRAGFGNGYLTVGLGLDVFGVQLNLATAFRPPYGNQRSVYGISAEIAIRF